MTSSLPPRAQRFLRRSRERAYRIQIDTTGERGAVALVDPHDRVRAQQTFPLDHQSPGALLRAIAVLRRQWSPAISGVAVVPGPGMFSRVRLGVVTANALAWTLRIPLFVRGRRVRLAKPKYGAPPHITPSPGGV